VDSKLIVTPSFKSIALNEKPISTTHVRDNDEHIDFKDIRLYFQTFRKQNINFIEILFTKYYIINPMYLTLWNWVIKARENIARYSPYTALKSMQGVAKEKYFAMEHRYPSKIDIIDKWGYDPKQLHHLLRIEYFINSYLQDLSYEKCLKPEEEKSKYLLEVKKGLYTLDEARKVADISISNIDNVCKEYFANHEIKVLNSVDVLLDSIQYEIMKESVLKELN
jgi:hypothetical protein